MERPSQHLLRFFDLNLPQTIVSRRSLGVLRVPKNPTVRILRLAIVALILLAACAETRGEKWRDQAADNLQAARLQWNDCSANPKCTGDDRFKARANLVDAQSEYDHANAQVHQEYGMLMHSMDQMQQQQQTDQITNAIRANQPPPVFQTMPPY